MSWLTAQYKDAEIPYIPDAGYNAFQAMPGKCIVEMCPRPEKAGILWLSDVTKGRLRPDVGVVLACTAPRDSYGGSLPMDILQGDAVLVRPGDGDWFMQGFKTETYETKREVRCFGIHGEASVYQATDGRQGDPTDTGLHHLIEWETSIVAKIQGAALIPTYRNLIVRPIRQVHYEIQLPDGVKLPTTECVIEAVSNHSQFKTGQRVAYLPDNDMDLCLGDDVFLIQENQVEALVIA
jgi:hypothetical protein